MAESEKLEVDKAITLLNEALELQNRSPLQYSLTAGSLVGFEYQSLAQQFQSIAAEELNDARALVEKITALGGDPTDKVAKLKWQRDPQQAARWLIDSETQTIDALQKAISATGREGRSEALEHLLEHIIMRKQNQLDFLIRASAI